MSAHFKINVDCKTIVSLLTLNVAYEHNQVYVLFHPKAIENFRNSNLLIPEINYQKLSFKIHFITDHQSNEFRLKL